MSDNLKIVVFTILISSLIFYGVQLFGYKIIFINVKQIKHTSQEIAEYGYFEGQRDVLNGDIRIEYKDGHWIWIKSPWDDGKIPILNLNTYKKE